MVGENPGDEDQDQGDQGNYGELDRIAETFARVKEFLEAGEFTLVPEGHQGPVTPIRKVALSSWRNYYRSLVMKPGNVIRKLYPLLDQCDDIETESLKSDKAHLIRHLSTLKLQYDSEIEILIDRLGSVTQDVLLRGFGENTNTHQERRISTYFMELQVEISTKIGRLSELNEDIGIRYTRIMSRVDYTGMPTSAARPNQPTIAQPSRTKYSPNPTFLEQGGNKDRAKPWYTTASDMMTESDITIIQE